MGRISVDAGVWNTGLPFTPGPNLSLKSGSFRPSAFASIRAIRGPLQVRREDHPGTFFIGLDAECVADVCGRERGEIGGAHFPHVIGSEQNPGDG